ncbi:helix-turn-helix domain-containing protein, partial [Streptomyces roseolilacinus]|uniref:helix-turn-helix domain-containing protein n=1 Tax=Streptomyces roseolilacinus TaxID=66904 RepID=UPI0037F694B7
MTASDLEQFAAWIEELIRRRGFDIDSPRGGGKSRLADEAGVHRAAITRLLQRQSMPDLETTRRLAHVLDVPVRDMLIRSGRLTEDDLPLPQTAEAPPRDAGEGRRLTLEEAAAGLGVPPEQREMFMKVAG